MTTSIAKIILSRRAFSGMKCCAALLLLCIIAVCPVSADTWIANCSANLQDNDGAAVRVSSVPDGALVTIDNNVKGTTPYEENIGLIGFAYGAHTLVLTKAGYETATVRFELCYRYLTDVRVDLVPATPAPTKTIVVVTTTPPPNTGRSSGALVDDPERIPDTVLQDTSGSLSVTTTPAGIEVFLDGSLRGISPITLDNLAPGTHTLLLKREGYADMTVPVMITAGQTQSIDTGMTPVTTKPAGTPGFGAALGIAALGAVLLLRKK